MYERVNLMAFIDIIFFAALAVFLGYRLWTLLGTHDPERPLSQQRPSEDEIVTPIRRSSSSSKTKDSVASKTSKAQSEDHFLQGAMIAFRKIVEAYGEGNVTILEKLLEAPLYETFRDSIEKRHKDKVTLEVDIDRISSSEILNRWEENGESYITVRFVSQQCLVTRNEKQAVVTGDPDRYLEVTDLWTFARPLKSRNPNWKLVATQLPET